MLPTESSVYVSHAGTAAGPGVGTTKHGVGQKFSSFLYSQSQDNAVAACTKHKINWHKQAKLWKLETILKLKIALFLHGAGGEGEAGECSLCRNAGEYLHGKGNLCSLLDFPLQYKSVLSRPRVRSKTALKLLHCTVGQSVKPMQNHY